MTEETVVETAESESHGSRQPEGSGGEEQFSREYVEGLRKEAAEHRVKAKRADDLQQRLMDAAVREGTAGILEDEDDLRANRGLTELVDADGFPDVEKVRAAAKELAEQKPHLARRRPSGDIGQGPRPEPSPVFDFAAKLREAAG